VKRIASLLLCLAPLNLCAAKLRVLTTTSDLASLAEAVGGQLVEVQSLAKGRQDPHFIDAKPSHMLEAHRADLFIRIGLDLEIGYEPLILQGARNPKILVNARGHLDASEGILPLEVPRGDVDRSLGDVHPKGNPHYWLDPGNGRIIAGTIARRLAALDPANAAAYEQHLQAFHSALDRAMFGPDLTAQVPSGALWEHQSRGDLLDWLRGLGKAEALSGWTGRMAPCRGARLVTFHRSFAYFARAFGLEVIDQLEPKPGIPPSPSHLADVIRKMQAQQVRVILQEPYYDPKASRLIAAKTGAVVVTVSNSVGGDERIADYIGLLDQMVNQVSAALADRES
jgi:ABC-type Zn uptake system ZnuABC Zn-binding protein ZnuA